MYNEKIKSILNDLEDKETEFAGGSVIGMNLSIVNSLIIYICNLTIGKERYKEVEEKVIGIKTKAESLKKDSLEIIDKDQKVLEEILLAYKTRKTDKENYENINKKAVEFCIYATTKALETLELVKEIGLYGNKLLKSDVKISALYAFSSVESSIENILINLEPIEDMQYKQEAENRYKQIYIEAKNIKEEIVKRK